VYERVVGHLTEPQRSRAFGQCVTFGRCGNARREPVADDRACLDYTVDHPVERDVRQWPVRVRPAHHVAMCAAEPDFLDRVVVTADAAFAEGSRTAVDGDGVPSRDDVAQPVLFAK
jgi:hypothetical protein